MTDTQRNAIYDRALGAYGEQNQCMVLMEECSELIQAVSKVLRYGNTPETLDHMAEEIADVSIMLEQAIRFLNIPPVRIAEWKCRKLERLSARIDNDSKKPLDKRPKIV